ncbi:oxidoreductase [Amycolatopsis antarctica]|uniref:Oxidoreductase n=1 Tax=Amycolatopsis antarctica TaxID=1854586 RepID=A0A263D6W1_9PSEU|nr:Gfo/Idh/MocA family oxidoreductase [Amycolatopsis antarctica]OZM74153.1 oxidoreductase [Amycolatopsis antarctica]
MSRRLSIGVLGCSAIARRRTLPVMLGLDRVRIAAVASRSAERAAEYATEFGCTPAGYDEVIERSDVDAVYICLPNVLHDEWTRRALEAGKHVLCEKPLTGDATQAKNLTELAVTRRLVLRENFAFLHHPQHERVRELVAEGRFGELRTLTASFGFPPLPETDIRYTASLGGGALLDAGVYPIRLAWSLFGDGLSVLGAALRVDRRLGVDVGGQALLATPRGVLTSLEFGFQHTYRSRYQLWGSSAAMCLDHAFTPPPAHRCPLDIEEQDHSERLMMPAVHQFERSIDSFVDAALGGYAPETERPWLSGARETARLAEEIRAVATILPGEAGAA